MAASVNPVPKLSDPETAFYMDNCKVLSNLSAFESLSLIPWILLSEQCQVRKVKSIVLVEQRRRKHFPWFS